MTLVLPRYIVGSVSGWAITASTYSGGRIPDKEPPRIWYVHDRLFCHRPVAEFFSQRAAWARGVEARARCNELNREYEDWLREQGLLP